MHTWIFLIFSVTWAGTNNFCPSGFNDIEPNCFACMQNVCRFCMEGYTHLKLGDPCVSIDAFVEESQTSLPVENVVFLQNSEIYRTYQDIWKTTTDMYANKFILQQAIAAIFTSTYGDDFDFTYITSIEHPYDCEDHSNQDDCEEFALCRWSSNSCRSSGGQYPHQYGNIPFNGYGFDTLLGTVFWQPSRGGDDMAGAFGTHFHEIGHHYLVWWDQYTNGRNNWISHQGTTGMERWGMMGGFDKDTITCESPSGRLVTSATSCNADQSGRIYLNFPSETGRSQFQSSDLFGTAQFSDWELLAMGMKSVSDLGEQTMMHCWAQSQTSLMESYPDTGLLEGYKVPCTDINFYTAQQLKDADNYWRDEKHDFTAAHIILLPDDVDLPDNYDEMPALFQRISDWLVEDLPAEFVKATRNSGTFNYRIGESTGGRKNLATGPCMLLLFFVQFIMLF